MTIAAALQGPFHENTNAKKTKVNLFLLHPPFNSRMFVKIKNEYGKAKSCREGVSTHFRSARDDRGNIARTI